MPLNEKFIISLQGKSYVTYEGLLDLAHQQNLESIHVDVLQLPSSENNLTAVCRATISANGKSFTDYGDASPNSVRSHLVPHIIRMASTRAKARALRDFTNIGMTSLEELDLKEIDEIPSEEMAFETRQTPSLTEEPPTKRQVDTIKKLSESLEMNVNIESLTKRTAGELISQMLEKQKRH